MKRIPLVELVILAYTIFKSWGLLQSWQDTPFVYWGQFAFLIWIIPVFYFGFQNQVRPLFYAALVFTLVGDLGSLNALCHIGLALAFAGFMPLRFEALIWFCAAAMWMPATGYFLKFLPLMALKIFRIVIVSAASLWMVSRKRV